MARKTFLCSRQESNIPRLSANFPGSSHPRVEMHFIPHVGIFSVCLACRLCSMWYKVVLGWIGIVEDALDE